MKPQDVMIGWTTVETAEQARQLARGLVEARLAACVQIAPGISSVYRWNGKVEEASEVRVTVKFPAARAAAIQEWLEKNHPYDVPQWICTTVGAGTEKYLNWVIENST